MLDLLHAALDWSGACARRPFWWAVAAAVLAFLGVAALEVYFGGAYPILRWSFVLAALICVPMVSLGVRRLHDAGLSGGWMLLALTGVGILPLGLLWARRASRARRGLFSYKPRHVWGLSLTGFISILLFLRAFYQPFWIPSGSMMPTLLPGDYVVARLMRDYAPERGDVAVFRHTATEAPYVKRVIGLGGDHIQIREGQVWLNGMVLAQVQEPDFTLKKQPLGPDEAMPRCANDPVGIGALCAARRARETLPEGRSYSVIDIERQGYFDTTAEFIVPDGAYFVLGDNRDNSLDSRAALGFVPKGHMIGELRRVIFSARGASLLAVWTWRPSRFLKAIE